MSREIEKLKREARRLHREIEAELSTADCGLTLLMYIRPSVATKHHALQAVLTRLEEIDPDYPRPRGA